MNIVKLTDKLAVSAQISPEDVAQIAAAGFKVLINNRPDGEEGTQASAAEIGKRKGSAKTRSPSGRCGAVPVRP